MHNGFFGLKINSNGLCNFCADPTHINPNWKKVIITDSLKKTRLNEWNDIIKELKDKHGQDEYSCMIGYSGGKDSTALIDTFINEYKLKPFLVSINTGFMTEIAKKNIDKTLEKMDLLNDHIFIEEAIPTFTKLYKHLFTNHSSNEKGLTINLCHICTDLIHTILVNEAIKRNIKYVFIGFSPDQIARYFFETSAEDVMIDGLPHPLEFKESLDKSDLKLFLNDKISLEHLPRVVYPYHVIEYDENEIIRRIEEKGLIERGKGDPVLTNCHVVKAALMYDLFRYGGITYALQYAELVRQKEKEIKKKARKAWLRILNNVGKSIINGTFDAEGIEDFLNKIGIKKDDLKELIEKEREKDQEKNTILRNIDLFKTNKLK